MPPILTRALSLAFRVFMTAFIVVSLGIAFFRPDLLIALVKWIGTLVESFGAWNYLIAFSAACLESFPVVGTALPGQQVMLLVGGFWGKTDFAGTVAVSILGACLGNWLGYVAGVYYGKDFLDAHGDLFGLGRTERGYLERQIDRNGAWFVILGKFHNFARAFVPFIAGSMGMRARTFWIYNIVGSVLWAATIVSLGLFFVQSYETILRYVQYVFLAIFALLAFYVAVFRREDFARYVAEKQKEIDEKTTSRSR